MIVKSDFQDAGVDDLVDYISEDEEREVKLKDSTGRELSREEVESFIDRSHSAEMQRQFIVAPDPEARYSPAEIDRKTRETLNDWKADKPSVEYVYGVHSRPESGKSHAHAAVIGNKTDLHMEKESLVGLRERARETFQEAMKLKSRERMQHREAEAESTAEPGREASNGGGDVDGT